MHTWCIGYIAKTIDFEREQCMLCSDGNPSTKNDDFTIPLNPYWSDEGSDNIKSNDKHPNFALKESSKSSATLVLVRYLKKVD